MNRKYSSKVRCHKPVTIQGFSQINYPFAIRLTVVNWVCLERKANENTHITLQVFPHWQPETVICPSDAVEWNAPHLLSCECVCWTRCRCVWAFPDFQSSSNARCCGFRTVKWVDGWVEWVHSDEKLPMTVESCEALTLSRSLAPGQVEMVWKGKWRLALWLFWHTSQELTSLNCVSPVWIFILWLQMNFIVWSNWIKKLLFQWNVTGADHTHRRDDVTDCVSA